MTQQENPAQEQNPEGEKNMHTATGFFAVINDVMLDIVPVAALCVLGISWWIRRRKYRQTEDRLHERIRRYRDQE